MRASNALFSEIVALQEGWPLVRVAIYKCDGSCSMGAAIVPDKSLVKACRGTQDLCY